MKFIVTGAASGIGRAVSLLASADRSDGEPQLVLVDLDAAGLDLTAHEAEANGAKAVAVRANLADPAECERIVHTAEAEFDGIDAIISNAGIIHVSALKDLEIVDFDRMFDVNTRPTWLMGKAAHKSLSRARGAIVATASISAEHPTPPLGSYSASKAALLMLVRQMALEWGPDGIRCNCVSPGPTYTGMTRHAFNDETNPEQRANRAQREALIPLRKLGQPEDVARTILFLASEAASHITGVNINVDGGLAVGLMPATGSGKGHANH